MNRYIVLLRGINVGGKNKVPMQELKTCLTDIGYSNVTTYIASGNVILESKLPVDKIKQQIEQALTKTFILDSELIKVLVLTKDQMLKIIKNKPAGFGEQPSTYHSDVIFLIGADMDKAMSAFNPRQGVDAIWKGDSVIYSQRLSAQRTKSRLNKIMSVPVYKSMTIRNWNTVTKLLEKAS